MNALIVDDDPDVLAVVAEMFERLGFFTLPAQGSDRALQLFEHFRCDLVVADLDRFGESGYDLAAAVKSHRSNTKMIIMTGAGIHGAHTALSCSIIDEWIFKPFGFKEIAHTLDRLELKHGITQ